MGSFKSFDGTRISYDTEGDGAPVVLLHGYASESFINWVRPGITGKLAASGYRAIAMDLRGHGMSDKPHDAQAYADGAMVKDARALLDHLDISKCFLVGFSMGAMNTARLLIEGEPRVAAAVLAGDAPDPTGGALFFHADGIAPGWFATRARTAAIGGNVFYR